MSDLSQEQRDKLPEADFGDPEGRKFPIVDQDDVDSAAHLIGKAGDPEAVKRRIIAIAKRKGLTVPDAWATKADEDGQWIAFGGACKALGDGKVGGYLVQFGGPADADADGEYFTSETDFDTEFPARASVYYNHGCDPKWGRKRLTRGAMKRDERGIPVEAQLDLNDPDQARLYRRVVAGEMGWSSGTASHITDPPRSFPGGAIKYWPLGIDASITPTPSDRRNVAVALKSWNPPNFEELGNADSLPASLAEDLERAADHIESIRGRCAGIAGKSGRKLSATRRERLARLRDELTALLDETDPSATADIAASRPGELPDDAEQSAIDIAETETLMLAFQAQANGVSLTAGAPL